MEEKKQQLFNCMSDVLKENGFRCELVRGGAENPDFLRIEAQRVGKIGQDILVELCYIPIALARPSCVLLQFYVTLFSHLPEKHLPELKKACDYVNDFSALGAFSVFEDAGQLFLRQNILLDLDGTLEFNINLLADNMSLLLASVSRFIDALAQIAHGACTVELAREQELLP